MLPKAFLATLALATSSATAMLLPSTFGIDVAEHVKHAHDGGENNNGNTVKVACPGCSMNVRISNDDHATNNVISMADIPNMLKFNFEVVSFAGEQDRILVNGFEVFPNVDYKSKDGLFAAQEPVPRHWPGHRKGGHGGEKLETKESEEWTKIEKEDAEDKTEEKTEEETEEETSKDTEGTPDRIDEIKRHVGRKNRNHHKRPHYPGVILPAPLGYGLEVHQVDDNVDDKHQEMRYLTLKIIQVNNEFIRGIPRVSVLFGRDTETGKLDIMVIGTEEFDHKAFEHAHAPAHPGHPAHANPHHQRPDLIKLEEELAQCSSVFCRWKVMMKARLRGMSCGGRNGGAKGHGAKHPHAMPGMHHGHHPHAEGNHHGHHGGHHSPHKHSWVQLLKQFTSHILLPVLIGIGAGIMVSLTGMALGAALFGAWRMVFGSRRSSESASQGEYSYTIVTAEPVAVSKIARTEEGHADEKAGLMSEPEPSQTELPPYEETDSKTDA